MDFKWSIALVTLLVVAWVFDLNKLLLSFFRTNDTRPQLSNKPISGSTMMSEGPSEPTTTTTPDVPPPVNENGTKLVRYLKLWNTDGVMPGKQNVAAYNGTHACTYLWKKCVNVINGM